MTFCEGKNIRKTNIKTLKEISYVNRGINVEDGLTIMSDQLEHVKKACKQTN